MAKDLAEMSAEELVNHLNDIAPPGSEMNEAGEQTIEALEQHGDDFDPTVDLPAPGTEITPEGEKAIQDFQNQSNEQDLINMIESLPAAGTAWTQEADDVAAKMEAWKNQDQLGPSERGVIGNHFNQSATGAYQNPGSAAPDMAPDNRPAPTVPSMNTPAM